MRAPNSVEAGDPRPEPGALEDPIGALRPEVAGAGGGGSLILVIGGAAVLGLLAFLWLSAHRPSSSSAANLEGAGVSAPVMSAPPPPPGVDAVEAEGRRALLSPPPAPPAVALVTPPPVAPAPAPVITPPQAPPPSGKTPVLVVDLAGGESAPPSPGPVPPAAKGQEAAHSAPGSSAGGNADEQFASRIANGPEPERARATMLRNQGSVVSQGTIIPAVLETALNSDLPGYARAVVSRDVASFDGSAILIPRGSRVIGEYKSAVALGQSRAFVIWTRVLRPDGGSIQIGSGGGDTLGRAGLSGSVDRHFFERFSGAVLLTVLNAGATALAGSPSTEVVVGSSSEATNLAGSASAFAPAAISPTIKVAQGTPVRIFVARDLDFTPVGGAGR